MGFHIDMYDYELRDRGRSFTPDMGRGQSECCVCVESCVALDYC